MDKTTLRIISKLGLLFVIIGFFMPISCNLNGFQIAKALETFGGPNLMSISLYCIFTFSCLGLVLLLVLVLKKPVKIEYDWYDLIGVTMPFIYFIYTQIKNQNDLTFGFLFGLQSGAYIIFIGLILSFVFLLKALKIDANEVIHKNSYEYIKNINFSKMLIKSNLENYTDLFNDNHLNDIELVVNLTEHDIERLGVINMGDRKKIIQLINDIRYLKEYSLKNLKSYNIVKYIILENLDEDIHENKKIENILNSQNKLICCYKALFGKGKKEMNSYFRYWINKDNGNIKTSKIYQ
jgi:hypothetical protein